MNYEISSGQVSSGIVLSENDTMSVYSGGVADHTIILEVDWELGMAVHAGGVADHTAVYDDGNLYVSSGGVAKNTTLYEDGYLTVFPGGRASGTLATGHEAKIQGTSDWNKENVSGSAFLEATTVKNGAEFCLDYNAVAKSTVVKNNAQFYISSGCTATATTVSDWGAAYVFYGGSGNGFTVASCGELHVARHSARRRHAPHRGFRRQRRHKPLRQG